MYEPPKFDSKLAWASYEKAKEDLASWWQGSWRSFFQTPQLVGRDGIARCGTTYCFGGWAAVLDGGQWLMSDQEVAEQFQPGANYSSDLAAYLLARPDEKGSHELKSGPQRFNGLQVVFAEQRAINALGLTNGEALYLFDSQRTLDEIKAGIEKIDQARAEGKAADFD